MFKYIKSRFKALSPSDGLSIGKKILNIFISVVSLGVIYFIHF